MLFQKPLIAGTLLRRYKRFLADVRLEDNTEITVYCPNTGSMLSCSAPGSPVYISTSDNLKRKYPHTLEMVWVDSCWVGVNTGLTNSLVVEAIEKNQIPELSCNGLLKREVTTSTGTRLDILHTLGKKKTFIEVKNCSMANDGIAMFPDAVTVRGTKHLNELKMLVKDGHRGVIFYLVQRMDVHTFAPAQHIDATYTQTLVNAYTQGVEILVYQVQVTPKGISLDRALPFTLPEKQR